MKKKYKFLIAIFILLQIIIAQDISISKAKKHTELSIGLNNSEFYTTDSEAGNGINIGIYRRQIFKNNWQIKTGFNYTSKLSKLKNVTVLPLYMIDWDSENYLYWRNFDLQYTYLEVNSFIEIPIYTYKNLKFNLLFGCGLEINLNYNFKMKNVKHEIFDQEKDKYEYSTGDHDIPIPFISNLENSGFTYQVGSSFIYKKLVLNIYYNHSINSIDYIDNMKFGEKFHTVNITLGYIFK